MEKSSHRICLTRPPYPAFFLRVFGNDGVLSYKAKCISTGFILYAIGLGVNIVSGTWPAFINDIGFLTNSILVGIVIFGVFAVCNQIDSTLRTIDKVVGHSQKKRFISFLEKWNGEPVWFVRERYWYHFHTLSLTILVALWSYTGVIGNYGWVIETTPNSLYHIFWSGTVGYISGVAVNRFGNYTFLINEYCELFLDPEKLNLIYPKTRKAFESLGRLALRADLVLAIPTIAILINSLSYWWKTGLILPFSSFSHLFMMASYACTLIFVFFFPLKNAHKFLVQIRTRAIERVEADLSLVFAKKTERTDSYSTIDSLLSIHDRLDKMSTWPLNLKSAMSASVIFLLPVLTGAVFQLILEYGFAGVFGR